jgi:MFS transporter, FHS family, L-fucose permease
MHNNTGIAMVVPLAFMVAAVTYPICVNTLPRYKIPADALGASAIGTANDTLDLEHANPPKSIEGAQIMEIEKR